MNVRFDRFGHTTRRRLKVAAYPPHQSWRKLLSTLDRLGCFSFLSALASIWRMRSRVTENCWPTDSSVWSLFIPMPKRMRRMRSSRGVNDASTRVVVSRRFDWIAASMGWIAFLSSMRSPRRTSSSSPTGVSMESGSLASLRTFRTFSAGMRSFSASSSGVGSRPISLSIFRDVRMTLLTTSIMCTGMRMARTIRIPVHVIEVVNKVIRPSRKMLNEIGREPTPEELAEKLRMPAEKVRKVLKLAREPLSIETPVGDEEDVRLGDLIEDKNAIQPIDAAIQSNLRETTTRVLASVTPREERVLRMRFGIGMNTDHTLEEVGQQFSVTRERIRQIEAKALRKLKHPSRSRKLRSFLDN